MDCLAVATSFPKERLLEAGARAVIAETRELAAWLGL
jgi:hypothetical protein